MAIWKKILPAKGAFLIKDLKERSLLVFLNNRIIGARKPDRSATAPDLMSHRRLTTGRPIIQSHRGSLCKRLCAFHDHGRGETGTLIGSWAKITACANRAYTGAQKSPFRANQIHLTRHSGSLIAVMII